MNYNPSPKDEFLQAAHNIDKHKKLVTDDDLRNGLSYALREYCRRISSSNPQDLGSAAMQFMKVKGAEEFLDVFLNLSEKMSVVHLNVTDNLPGNKAQPRK